MIINYLKIFVRNFKRFSGHSFLTLLGLSIAIACALLIYLWGQHQWSFDKFHADADKLYKVITHRDADGSKQTFFLAGHNIDITGVPEVEAVTHISTGNRWPHELCFWPDRKVDECVYLNGVYASENLFDTFSFPIVKGVQEPLNNPASIAISEKMAETLYGSEDPIGKTIMVDRSKEVIVTAVFRNIPEFSSIKFDFALPMDVLQKQWGMTREQLDGNFFDVYIKGISGTNASLISEKLNDPRVIGESNKSYGLVYEAVPFSKFYLNSNYENGINKGGKIDQIIQFGLIGLLLILVAITNFINLTTARASLRAKEIGVKKAIGANRKHLIFQFLFESYLMVFMAFLVGFSLTGLLLPAFNRLVGEQLSLMQLININSVIFFLGFLLLMTLLSGAYPAFLLSSLRTARILKGLSSVNSDSLNIRKALITFQLAVSIGIILFGSIIYYQLDFVQTKNLGFDRENVIRLEPTYRLLQNYGPFKNELLKYAEIEQLSASDANPLEAGAGTVLVQWPGKSPETQVSFQVIGSQFDFPELLGLQITDGRSFHSEKDTKDSTATEAVISLNAAKMMGLSDPVGATIRLYDYISCEIIGVVNDFHTNSMKESMEPVIIYRKPIEQVSAIYVKYAPGKAREAVDALKSVYSEIEPDFTMKYWFQDQTFDNLYKSEIVVSRLVIIFSFICFVTAVIGIIGLATFNAMRKTKEIGIRRVFGASSNQVMGVMVSEFIWPVLLALGLAIPLSWYAGKEWLMGFAYRINFPWQIIGLLLFGLLIIIFLIIWFHAQKTISANPTASLRSE
ncbi:ABC transporter permease [Cecembia calidifontis]|uniref:MacB-like protein n=1 Tax=Cecembia calidifontis TaxID=1187080 RepID=A0A4Q7PDR9_9BACT|nr:ABC transporter permease [Cecembia calidifontis]RZS97770.1 MacB-like protein [Cecembia calidifontis]